MFEINLRQSDILGIIFISGKERDYVLRYVRLFACQLAYSKSHERILVKVCMRLAWPVMVSE